VKISSNLAVNIAKRNRRDSLGSGGRPGPDARRGRRDTRPRPDWDNNRADGGRGGGRGAHGGRGNGGQGGGRYRY
jgi:hypothetical protein